MQGRAMGTSSASFFRSRAIQHSCSIGLLLLDRLIVAAVSRIIFEARHPKPLSKVKRRKRLLQAELYLARAKRDGHLSLLPTGCYRIAMKPASSWAMPNQSVTDSPEYAGGA